MLKIFGRLGKDRQSQLNDIGLLLLRVGLGLSMIYGHGWNKFVRMFGDDPIKFADPLGLGMELSFYLVAIAEFVCAGLIVIGLFTRAASIPFIITMLVAVFLVHWPDSFGDKELALIYLVGSFVILIMGPGKYSLDDYLGKPK